MCLPTLTGRLYRIRTYTPLRTLTFEVSVSTIPPRGDLENPAGFAPDLTSFADWCVTTPPKVRLVAPEGVEPSTLASE